MLTGKPIRTTKAQRALWKQLHIASTQGKWDVHMDREYPRVEVVSEEISEPLRICTVDEYPDRVKRTWNQSEADASFIAAAHEALPSLVAHVEQLESALETVRGLCEVLRHIRDIDSSGVTAEEARVIMNAKHEAESIMLSAIGEH